MIDDDTVFNPESIFRLLQFDKEVMALPVPLKEEKLTFNLNSSILYTCPQTGLHSVKRIGVAVMLLRRSAVIKMMEAFPQLKADGFGRRKHQPTEALPEWERVNRYYFNLFEWGVSAAGSIIGEDMTFCDRWTSIGGEIFVDDSQWVGHAGGKVYWGRLQDTVNPSRMKVAKGDPKS